MLYFIDKTGLGKQGISSGSTLFAIHPAILDTTVGSKLYLFKF